MDAERIFKEAAQDVRNEIGGDGVHPHHNQEERQRRYATSIAQLKPASSRSTRLR